MTIQKALVALAGLALFGALCAPGLAGNDIGPHSGRTANFPSADYPQGPCNVNDLKDPQSAVFQSASPAEEFAEAAFLKRRIYGCRAIILASMAFSPTQPTPTPLPTFVFNDRNRFLPPPPTPLPTPRITPPPLCVSADPVTHNDPRIAYADVVYCQTWIAQNLSTPAAATTPTPSPSITPPGFHDPDGTAGRVTNKIIYVVALASDAPSSAEIDLTVARELQNLQAHAPFRPDPYLAEVQTRYHVVVEPSWQLANYQQQCASDRSTAGAIVIFQPTAQTADLNVLFSISSTSLSMQAVVLDCEPVNTAYVGNKAFVTWASSVHSGVGRSYGITVSTILAALSAYTVFHPTTQTSYDVATPSPSPAPGASYPASFMRTNGSSDALLAAAGLSGATQLGSSTLLAEQKSVDVQQRKAILNATGQLLGEMRKYCKENPQIPATVDDARAQAAPADHCTWFDWL